jgi:hypothetical protein
MKVHAKLRKQGAAKGAQAPAIVHDVLRRPGQPMGAQVRRHFEQRMGQDFSHVRVHTDAQAAESAQAVSARAYTVGPHVVFGPGRYEPTSPSGQKLLAHELTHVVQQRNVPASKASVLQRDALSGVASLTPALPTTLDSAELEDSENLSASNPKLVQIAEAYKSHGDETGVRVSVSADLPPEDKANSANADSRSRKLGARMRLIRDALVTLGVPERLIDIGSASAFSTSAHGQVSVSVRQSTKLNPLLKPNYLGPTLPPAKPGAGPSLSDMLTLKFGPVSIELPKSAKAKLPIALSGGRTLVIDLQAELLAKFSLKIALDGTPHVRVSVGAGVEYDPDKKTTTGTVGLSIESQAKTCQAANPEALRQKIAAAGEKLTKASKEASEAADAETRNGKLIDIASAVGEMYDAVDKAKAGCKPAPTLSVDFGAKKIVAPGDEKDPKKLQDFVGVSATLRF